MTTQLHPGGASPAGSAALARRFGGAPRRLGRSQWQVAPIGFGAYRVHDDNPAHRQALEEALRCGINLIDTSATYTDGGSERLIGGVLAQLFADHVLQRDQVVVVSKAGYLQGPLLEAAKARPTPYPEIVEYLAGCWHCIHPELLAEQIEASRQRLGLARIDVYLLHNPEYFLIDRRNRGGVDDDDRERLYRRIAAAFAYLERAVLEGLIGCYGVSSNALAGDAPEHIELDRLLEIAREVGGEAHHFAVIELPLNLLEGSALRDREPTPAGPRTALEIAAAADLGVLVNRPLSGFVQDPEPRLIRLADLPESGRARASDPLPLLRAAERLELEWQRTLGDELAREGDDPRFRDLFRWGRELSAGLPAIRDINHWIRLRNGVIAAHMGQLGALLHTSLSGDHLARFRAFWDEYGAVLEAALDSIEDGLRAQAQAVLDQITERLDAALPLDLRPLTLSQKAVLTLLAAPVSAVLVGARIPAYVHDIAALAPWLTQPAFLGLDPAEALRAFVPTPLH
ncbi:MAG: aldo/keto reductase [Nannocystis sp.]|nr:aldo/keto reductase [Nannocystis sp.]